MTPFARRLCRAMIDNPQMSPYRPLLSQLADSVCFDVSPVFGLIQETAVELYGTHEFRGDEPWVEHGGLLFMPAQRTWIEARPSSDASRHFGALIEQTEDQIGFVAFNHEGRALLGFLELQPDDEHFVVRADLRQMEDYNNTDKDAAYIGMYVAAALLLINAPTGVERRTEPPHKGFARELRQATGLAGLRPTHTIRLSKAPKLVGEASEEGGSPKAFHFCRSHLRRLPSGGVTRVRAHWRGDPSLGICRGVYRLSRQAQGASA